MTRLLASGDHHFDEHSRFDECIRVHAWIAERVRVERPDVFLSGGDLFERASTPRERHAAADWLSEVAEVCPVVLTRGNHDPRLDAALLGRISAQHRITVQEAAGVHVVGGAAIMAVAWPRKAELLARGSAPGDATVHLRNIFGGLGAEAEATGLPRISLGHFMVDGSMTSTGQPLCGADMAVGLADLALMRAQFGVMAHIHKPQEFRVADADFLYTGSPFRTAFGEMEEKSIVLAEVTTTGAEWRRLPTPATRMVHIEATWTAFGFAGADRHTDEHNGAEIRLRYRCDADRRDAARVDAQKWADELLHFGAASVKLEEVVIAATRTRTPAIAAARTLPEKLSAHWEAKGVALDDARRVRVLSKVVDLEIAS